MSVFSASMNHRSFHWQISGLCFVLGLLLAAAWHTTNQVSRAGNAPARAEFSYWANARVAAENARKSEAEIKALREKNSLLETQIAKGDADATALKALNEELQNTKFLAGLVDAYGPGVQVVLRDSKKAPPIMAPEQVRLQGLVHDHDIASVVNELKASGAEAVAVNGKRVTATTAIRCVGPVVHVNSAPCAPPYVIQAVGDPDALLGGLNLPEGVLEDMRGYDPEMVRIEKKEKITVSAFAGGTQMRFAKPVPAKKPAGTGEGEKGDRAADKADGKNAEGKSGGGGEGEGKSGGAKSEGGKE